MVVPRSRLLLTAAVTAACLGLFFVDHWIGPTTALVVATAFNILQSRSSDRREEARLAAHRSALRGHRKSAV